MLSLEDRHECYRRMITVRYFEEAATDYFKRGLVPGFIHSSIGQEAVAVGLSFGLSREDYITSTHRGHGHMIAKGANLTGMAAEILGRATGLCRGRGGSMHVADAGVGALGANGIVGSGIPIATGAGLGVRVMGRDSVVMCFFGDGAVNTGAFHEGLNLAAVWRLPVIFVCENNQYAESTPIAGSVRIDRLSVRGDSYGIPGETIDGNDIEACVTSGSHATARARAGEGPSLIEAVTYRRYGHHTGDPAQYRTKSEVEEWGRRDPIDSFRSVLMSSGSREEAQWVETTEREVRAEVDTAFAAADAAPAPDPGSVMEGVFGRWQAE